MKTQDELIKFYRSMLCEGYGYKTPVGEAEETHFLHFLEERYRESKARLSERIADGEPMNIIIASRQCVWRAATGLVTYGRLDVVGDILDHVPNLSPGADISRLTWVLLVVMPMPKELDPLRYPEKVRSWVEEHKSHLHWDNRQHKFILEGN